MPRGQRMPRKEDTSVNAARSDPISVTWLDRWIDGLPYATAGSGACGVRTETDLRVTMCSAQALAPPVPALVAHGALHLPVGG